MENLKQLKKNVRKNYIYILLQNINLTSGIWMLYLAFKGMSLTQLGLLETIFHLTSFTMEVPTGAIADIYGRRISRILGRVLYLGSLVLLLFSNSFWWFAASFMLSALSYNLESGAGDALVYDSLKEIDEEDQYMRICGNKEVFFQVACTISFLAGGYLASKSYTSAYLLSIIIGAITLLQSMTFIEPTIGKKCIGEKKGNVFVQQLKESIAVIKNNPRIGALMVFTQLMLTLCTCMFFYLQNYLKGSGYNEAAIGLIYAVSSLAAAYTATKVHELEKRIKEKGILLLVPFIMALCIWGVALSRYHYIFFVLLMVMEGILFVATNDYINKMIPSENRATILSFASMVCSFFMIILFPLVGFIGDHYSLNVAFMVLGTVGIGTVIVQVKITN